MTEKIPSFIKQVAEFVAIAKRNNKQFILGDMNVNGVLYTEKQIKKLIKLHNKYVHNKVQS